MVTCRPDGLVPPFFPFFFFYVPTSFDIDAVGRNPLAIIYCVAEGLAVLLSGIEENCGPSRYPPYPRVVRPLQAGDACRSLR